VLAVAATVVLAAIVGGAITLAVTRPAKTGLAGSVGLTGIGSATGHTGVTGAAGPRLFEPSLAQPLPEGEKVSLSDAESALEGSIVLPDTAQVTPSDLEAVWLWLAPAVGPSTGQGVTAAAVTFPSQGFIVRYWRRSQVPDTFAFFDEMAKNAPGSKVLSLSGHPALLIPQDLHGSSWGSIEFVLRGNTTEVMGNVSDVFLQDIAQSIVDRAAG
jgi:hypothetical protein